MLPCLRAAYFLVRGHFAGKREWLPVHETPVAAAQRCFLKEERMRMYIGLRHADAFAHVNHARYFEMMEYCRWFLAAKTGTIRRWQRSGVYPVVSSVHSQYVREMMPLRVVEVSLQTLGWDGKCLTMYQEIRDLPRKRKDRNTNELGDPKGTLYFSGIVTAMPVDSATKRPIDVSSMMLRIFPGITDEEVQRLHALLRERDPLHAETVSLSLSTLDVLWRKRLRALESTEPTEK